MAEFSVRDRGINPKSPLQIPGIVELIGSENDDGSKRSNRPVLAPSLFLLTGPSGVGKTVYCRQFLIDALQHGYHTMFLTAAISDRQFKMLFPADSAGKLAQSCSFINPYIGSGISNPRDSSSHAANRLSLALAEIRNVLSSKTRATLDTAANLDNTESPTVCVVVDSLTEFFLLFDEPAVLKFITELCLLLKQFDATAILVLASVQASTSVPALASLPNILASFVDGILEMKTEEEIIGSSKKGSLVRSIRLLSMKGMYHKPDWIPFRITSTGTVNFGNVSSVSLNCTMCGNPITGVPIMDSDFAFDTKSCVETYHRLAGIYGSGISEISGLPSQVVNMNFFFIDIVGLSNPAQSVKRQIEKIEILNRLIGSCDAFARNKETKIVLPTGDGMAIGFYTSVESPFLLATQLHSKLFDYNRSAGSEQGEMAAEGERDRLGVRIGLGSGPVFIVNDIKGNQNVWGPGIILSRRVMDIGDNRHILISGNMAEMLVSLRDEYKRVIQPIGDYQIKHGQTIKIYSAFSDSFGNANPPAKLVSQHQ
jgi:KaiC/GvpD/RAD55 family RecA-like ATPase/class 3 adenylate cyclase